MTTTKELIQCIQSTNTCLSMEHLQSLDYEGLLRNVHPLYRTEYARKLYNEGKINKIILLKFAKLFVIC